MKVLIMQFLVAPSGVTSIYSPQPLIFHTPCQHIFIKFPTSGLMKIFSEVLESFLAGRRMYRRQLRC